jgi:hypothetical protein
MIVVAFLNDRNPVLIDHSNRLMYHLPSYDVEFPSHYTTVNNDEIARYLYEYTYMYDKHEVIRFEE